MRPTLLLVAVLLGCGEEAPRARVEPEPRAPIAEAPRPGPLSDPDQAPAPQPDAPAQAPPVQPPVRATAVERAIEPVEGAARVVATALRGQKRYVLFTWDGDAVARARIGAMPDGDEQLEAIEYACDDEDDYGRFGCAVAVAPDPYVAASMLTDRAHAWGVAIVEARGGEHVRTARRFLFALSTDEGTALDRPAELRVRDADRDGEEELIVTLPIVPLRDDSNMNGGDSGVIAYVLDASDLRTQFRVTADYESMVMDVAGTTTTCRGAWRFADVNGDGRDDITVRSSCTEDWQDEESGDSQRTRSADRRDCLYDAASDAWPCGEPAIAAWLFGPSSSGAVLAEAPEQLSAAMGGVGARFDETLAAHRAEMGEAEGGGDGESRDPAPLGVPRCVHVVQDPAPPLRVRASPSARAEIAGELPNGTELVLLEHAGRWSRIERPVVGWVYRENVQERCAAN
jgi:hypothetical protein